MPTKKTTDNKETSNQKKTKSSAGGFAKGHKKVGGRKKGSPNKITADLRNMIKEQIAPWIARIGEDMKALEPAERLQAIAHQYHHQCRLQERYRHRRVYTGS